MKKEYIIPAVGIVLMKDDIMEGPSVTISGSATPQDPSTTDAKAGAADLWDEE